MQLYLTSAVLVHLPEEPAFFMMEPFLMEPEGSQKNPPLFSRLQADQRHNISLFLICLLCYSSLLSQWPPLHSLQGISAVL